MNKTDHHLYPIWDSMKQRCSNPNNPRYPSYGGRGISICSRWLADFWNFIDDMGPRPNDCRRTIERIDNDGNYTPDNCRWATYSDQNKNRRTIEGTVFTYEGKTQHINRWAEEYELKYTTLRGRLDRGWDLKRALTTPYVSQREAVKTRKQRKDAVLITAFGKTQTLVEWSKETGIAYPTIQARIKRGWPVEEALET